MLEAIFFAMIVYGFIRDKNKKAAEQERKMRELQNEINEIRASMPREKVWDERLGWLD